MHDPHTLLLSYVPVMLQHELRERTTPLAGPEAHQYPAAVLFADLSGFTALTEQLMRTSEQGVEEIMALLNRYYTRMNSLVAAEGGEVIQFTGDGLTALFVARQEALGRTTRRAAQAADAMLHALGEFANYPTSIGPVSLELKVGLAAGEITTIKAGGQGGVWHWLVTGYPLRQLGALELAPGQCVLSPEAALLVVNRPLPPHPLIRPDPPDDPALLAQMCGFVSLLVQRWMAQNMAQWLGARRTMSVVMIKLWEDREGEQLALEALHSMTILAEQLMDRHRGLLRQVAIDEKGTTLVCVLGAPPYSGPDDASRAVQCGLELLSECVRAERDISVGIASGLVFSGPIGDDNHREYTVIGDVVNLAARLMGHAERGQILCDNATYRSSAGIAWEGLPPVRLKGKSGFIRLFQPRRGPPSGQQMRALDMTNPLIERQTQLEQVEAMFQQMEAGHPQLMLIEGDAGTGKSRLLEAATQIIRRRGLVGLMGFGSALERDTPYSGWKSILLSYFGLTDTTDLDVRQQRVRQLVTDLAPEQLERLPLLNDALDLRFPDTPLTAALEATLRPNSLALLLGALFRRWISEQPLVLAIEDAHWLDTLSWELAVQLTSLLWREGGAFCLLLLLRPMPTFAAGQPYIEQLRDIAPAWQLSLADLTAQSTATLMAVYLGVLRRSLPPELVELVYQRTNGNPALIQELVMTLSDQDMLRLEPDLQYPDVLACVLNRSIDEVAAIVPLSSQGMLLSRIDALAPELQLLLKAAAAIGRVFEQRILEFMLAETNPAGAAVAGQLHTLIELRIIVPVIEQDTPTLRFKHGLMQEALYINMLFSQRQLWHAMIIQWYEEFYPAAEGRQRFGALLAQHSASAGDDARELAYSLQAGELAMERYAMREAVEYFSRALALTPPSSTMQRYEILVHREQLYDQLARRQPQHQDLLALEALLPLLPSDCELRVALRRANYADAVDDYTTMLHYAELARDLAEQSLNPLDASAAELTLGRLYWKRGDYPRALDHLHEALARVYMANDLALQGDVLRNLGVVLAYSGDYGTAQTATELALLAYRQAKRPRGESAALNNLGRFTLILGDYHSAEDMFTQALTIDRSLGLRSNEALTMINLAIAATERGAFHRGYELTQASLSLSHELGDRYGEVIAMDNLADIARSVGDFDTSLMVYRQALKVCAETSNRRMEAEIRAGMALLALWRGDVDVARAEAEQARAIAARLGARREEGLALTVLAYAATPDEQIARWQVAWQHWQLLDDRWRILEAGIGWAAASFASAAEPALNLVLDYLDLLCAEPLCGVSDAMQVYVSAATLLRQARSEYASIVVDRALQVIQQRARLLNDSALIDFFFERIPSHRALMDLTAQLVMPGANGSSLLTRP